MTTKTSQRSNPLSIAEVGLHEGPAFGVGVNDQATLDRLAQSILLIKSKGKRV